MSSASFRLESFRPWNPFQDKAQPPQDSLDICRYPSPVSITATPPPSNSSNSASMSQKIHPHSSERHPLPARPPVEVCFDGGLHSDSQTTGCEPEGLGRTTPADIYAGAFDSEGISQSQDLSVPENVNSAIISGYICPGAEHQFPSVDCGDLEPADITGQLPQDVDSGNHILTRELPGFETIDPAILNDHACPGVGQIQAAEIISGMATCQDRSPSECSHFPNQDRQNAEGTADPKGQSTKINKVPRAGKRCSKIGASQPSKRPRRRNSVSFPTIRAQFSALPVEDRLLFLSWLFESALSHCVSTRPNTDVASISRCGSSQDEEMIYDCDQSSSNTELVDAQQPPSRKGLPWSMEEKILLVTSGKNRILLGRR